MRSIVDEFVCVDGCPYCLGTGYVCSMHPGHAWGPVIGEPPDDMTPRTDGAVLDEHGACHCDADGGMPCPGVPA